MKIYLGIHKEYGAISITEHEWQCGWYWAFGYLGNNNTHFHLESMLDGRSSLRDHFSETWITDKQWWIVRDLAIQAYALKKAAEVYKHGGHQTFVDGITNKIRNLDRAAEINKDLEIVLDTLWDLLTKWHDEQVSI